MTELWKTDGSSNGTIMVKDIEKGISGSSFWFIDLITNYTSRHLVTCIAQTGQLMGRSPIKTVNIVKNMRLGFTELNGDLYFSANNMVHGAELWKSNGTGAGTEMIKDINPSYSSSPSYLTAFKGELYFQANSTGYGVELWKSDGTTNGTVMVKDIASGDGSSFPSSFAIFANELYFHANNGINGDELWKTDGTVNGTVMVKT